MKQWMTFGIKTEGAKKAEKDIDGVAKSTKKAEASQEGLNDSIEQGSGALNNMTGGAIGAFKGIVGGVKKAVMGMRTLKGAVMATGIGALVLIVGSLVAYFTKTKKGMEVLQVATAALGAVMGVLTDVLSSIGEVMVWAFNSPQEALDAVSEKMEALGGWFSDLGSYLKEVFFFSLLKVKRAMLSFAAAGKELLGFDSSGMRAQIAAIDDQLEESIVKMKVASDKVTAPLKKAWNDVKDGVSGFIDKVGDAITTAAALERRAIKLADAQRELGVEFAKTREQMNKLRMIGEDITQEVGVRIAAIEEAGALEQELANKSLALAQEAVDIKREQNNISESTAEDLQALADLEIALSNAQIESSGKQRALLMKVNALYAEQEAAVKAATEAEEQRLNDLIARQDIIDAQLESARSREIQKMTAKYKALEVSMLNGEGILINIKEAASKELAAINAKHDKVDRDRLRSLHDAKTKMATDALGVLMALNSAFAGDTKEQQKKAFQRNKKMGISSALINTASAIIGAISPAAGGLGLPAGLPGAIMAGATGAAQIATIAKTRVDSSGGGTEEVLDAGSGGGGGGDLESQASNAPQIDMGFLGQGSGSSMQAYVISEQVNNQLQADQIVTDQTTL